MSDDIGLVIAKGMAVTYKAQPRNPVDFFARWLLNHSQVAKSEQAEEEKAIKKRVVQEEHLENLKKENEEKENKKKEAKAADDKLLDFKNRVNDSKDLEYELPALVDHIQEHTGATAVYIGKVVLPKKKIKDDDNDQAHIDAAAEPQVLFQYASGEHEFMVDKILKQDEGVTYGLFRDEPAEEGEPPATERQEGEEEEVKEVLPKHIYVPEVVREEKMHWYEVPRLGSYLAIKMEYNSCLSEEAFDAALKDYQEVTVKKEEQEKEVEEHKANVAQA